MDTTGTGSSLKLSLLRLLSGIVNRASGDGSTDDGNGASLKQPSLVRVAQSMDGRELLGFFSKEIEGLAMRRTSNSSTFCSLACMAGTGYFG